MFVHCESNIKGVCVEESNEQAQFSKPTEEKHI